MPREQWASLTRPTAVAALVMLLASGASPAGATHFEDESGQPPHCSSFGFDPANFPSTPRIDNPLFPLTPGTQAIFEGRADRGGGPLPHQVIFTATDLTKVIAGIRTVVMWDIDINEGVLSEAELAFFAQDNNGTVWNLGEYPEEYEDRTFVGAPSTWIHGVPGAPGGTPAEAGVHMRLDPSTVLGEDFHVQGFVPDIEFLDCAKVVEMGTSLQTSLGAFQNVLVSHEISPYDNESSDPATWPIQVKYYAPGVGIVLIDFINDPEGEILERTATVQLSKEELANARRQALRLDKRGYRTSEVYRQTLPIETPRRSTTPRLGRRAAAKFYRSFRLGTFGA